MRFAPLVLLLGACTATTPAPVTFGRSAPGGGAAVAPASAPAPRTAAPIEIRTPDEPAPNWAAGPGTPLSVYALQPEQAAPYDPLRRPQTHAVAAGETLYGISVRYQIPLRPLIETNALEAPFHLRAGQTLRLPPPRTHRVRRGETLLSVARRYNIDARSLALLNRLPKPYEVRAGDTLVLPALARSEAEEAPTPAPPPNARGPTRFAWPLTGRILTRFGAQPGGRRSDGVDIAAPEGADVKAAADGRVVYAGDDLAGYGNLLLVQHADNWITAYAHCRNFAVKEGDRVRQGQKIAQVGKSADGAAKLHFQLRRSGAATDPLAALPPT